MSETDQRIWRGWLVAFALAAALYAATANRGAQWQDSGYHILRVVTHESLNPLGLALSHPLHHWLGRAVVSAGVFEPAFAITLLSALAAAVTVANVYGCVKTMTRHTLASALAAASLLFAHTFWQLATVVESYTLTAALLSGEIWCLCAYAKQRRPAFMWGMLLLNGLGTANHLAAVLTTPVLAVVILVDLRRGRLRLGHLATGIALWVVGGMPYTAMVIAEMTHSGETVSVIRSALFGASYAGAVLNTTLSLHGLAMSAGFVLLNFPNLLLPAALYAIIGPPRREMAMLARRAILAGFCIHSLFWLRYSVVDQHYFFVPMYVFLAILGGVGFAALLRFEDRAWPRRVSVAVAIALAITPVFYFFLPTLARRYDLLESVKRNKPYRDDYTYLLTPWLVVERSAEHMSNHALDLAGDDGVIVVEDPMAIFAVRYKAIMRGKQAVVVSANLDPESWGTNAASARSVVLVPQDRDKPIAPPPNASWERDGDLYLLVFAADSRD